MKTIFCQRAGFDIRSDMLFIFNIIFLQDNFRLSVVSLSRQRHILDFSCCPLSRVLYVTLANLQKFGFEFHLGTSSSEFRGWSADQPITSFLATPYWRDPTRSKQLSTVAVLGFQFGLSHVVAPLSFLRSISPASLFSCLLFLADQTFYRSYVNRQPWFSFAVLCIVMFRHITFKRDGVRNGRATNFNLRFKWF